MDPKVREIIERVKATAMNAAEAAGHAMDVATQKAGEFVDVTKLNLKVFDLNTDIDLLYKEIGKNVYLTHTGEEVDPELIEEKIAEIDEKMARIEELKAEITNKKNTTTCPNCGCECQKGDSYCRVCGAAM